MSTALTFVDAPPGLEPLVDFTLDDVAGATGLHELRAAANPSVRLFLLDAPVYLPWYVPAIDNASYDSLGIHDAAEADVMVVATLAGGSPIVNLMAPMVVNRATGAAAQVILGDEWPLRADLATASTA